jgi:hypothetical protein
MCGKFKPEPKPISRTVPCSPALAFSRYGESAFIARLSLSRWRSKAKRRPVDRPAKRVVEENRIAARGRRFRIDSVLDSPVAAHLRYVA